MIYSCSFLDLTRDFNLDGFLLDKDKD
jgi:hypothetical protein